MTNSDLRDDDCDVFEKLEFVRCWWCDAVLTVLSTA